MYFQESCTSPRNYLDALALFSPCSLSTRKIEELIVKLKKEYTIVIVTHNMQQALRISDKVGFMYLGELIEFGTADTIFNHPENELTTNYIGDHFG